MADSADRTSRAAPLPEGFKLGALVIERMLVADSVGYSYRAWDTASNEPRVVIEICPEFCTTRTADGAPRAAVSTRVSYGINVERVGRIAHLPEASAGARGASGQGRTWEILQRGGGHALLVMDGEHDALAPADIASPTAGAGGPAAEARGGRGRGSILVFVVVILAGLVLYSVLF